ncbi:hypothetical protein [Sphingobacterium wenxiniae]|uniref:Uncharacterized protein n=1 Tax=Sphingobacterium wenxiniae TaxID=683125 RepID=A0A1I6Q9L9_9SPHI|nr:hypothetical protein [Sphingobacterium wenxiniae]SFS49157.1 hypothetical protein SAMN05660206_102211 [Sphingobacterium wenxiniae]
MELLWCQFFIDAYNKGIYEFAKDFLMPGTVLFLTVYFSIHLSKEEFRRQLEKEKNDKLEFDNTTSELIKITIPKLSEKLSKLATLLEKQNLELSYDKYENMVVNKTDGSFFTSLKEIGYKNSYYITKNILHFSEEDFMKYWEIISNTPHRFRQIEEYLLYVSNEYNRINSELNKLTHSISHKTSHIIHDRFGTYSTHDLSHNQLEEPRTNLAYNMHLAVENFQKDETNNQPIKIRNFLMELDLLKTNEIASKELSSEYAQEIVYALARIQSIEKLFEVTKETNQGYIKRLREDADKLNSLIK